MIHGQAAVATPGTDDHGSAAVLVRGRGIDHDTGNVGGLLAEGARSTVGPKGHQRGLVPRARAWLCPQGQSQGERDHDRRDSHAISLSWFSRKKGAVSQSSAHTCHLSYFTLHWSLVA